jgi:hypothetical protein
MHMTRLPGFSAEASLSPSSAVYQVDPLSRVLGQRRKGGVQPPDQGLLQLLRSLWRNMLLLQYRMGRKMLVRRRLTPHAEKIDAPRFTPALSMRRTLPHHPGIRCEHATSAERRGDIRLPLSRPSSPKCFGAWPLKLLRIDVRRRKWTRESCQDLLRKRRSTRRRSASEAKALLHDPTSKYILHSGRRGQWMWSTSATWILHSHGRTEQ